MDTKELNDVIDFALAAVKVFYAAEADGKIDLNDLALLFPLIPSAQAALSGADQIPAELKDLDPTEAAELVARVMAGFTVSDPKARQIIDASLKFALDGFSLYKAIKA